MTYPCAIIKDLLPLYIDAVCNEESTRAVEEHLSGCEKCKSLYEAMAAKDDFAENHRTVSEDIKRANSLKKVKFVINKKIILSSAAAVIFISLILNFLFNFPLKTVSPNDVFISAKVYSLAENTKSPSDKNFAAESEYIFSDESDTSDIVTVTIPELGNIKISEEAVKKCKFVTSVSVNSEYFLRTIKQKTKGDTIYISAFKTTLLNNKAKNYQKTAKTLEFKEIKKIIYADSKGKKTVLWEK